MSNLKGIFGSSLFSLHHPLADKLESWSLTWSGPPCSGSFTKEAKLSRAHISYGNWRSPTCQKSVVVYFYTTIKESFLTSSITIWYAAATAKNRLLSPPAGGCAPTRPESYATGSFFPTTAGLHNTAWNTHQHTQKLPLTFNISLYSSTRCFGLPTTFSHRVLFPDIHFKT